MLMGTCYNDKFDEGRVDILFLLSGTQLLFLDYAVFFWNFNQTEYVWIASYFVVYICLVIL